MAKVQAEMGELKARAADGGGEAHNNCDRGDGEANGCQHTIKRTKQHRPGWLTNRVAAIKHNNGHTGHRGENRRPSHPALTFLQ